MQFTATVVENVEITAIMIEEATLLQANMKANNGIIHVIDRVLIPEGLELPYKNPRNDNDGISTPTTPNPTRQPSPSTSPTSTQGVFSEMLAFAQTVSSSSSLSDPSSPQYKAVEWLAQDKVDNGSNWTGYELVQRYVLRVLYVSNGGENWYGYVDVYSTWFGASSVCDWGSINLGCHGSGQQVDSIDLDTDNLRGTIPDELGLLTALTTLYLYGHQLTGTIPTQLGQLTALTLLDLSVNQLTGTIPTDLTLLTNLNSLLLEFNNLTGQVPSGFCAAPFPDWRADGAFGNNGLSADCISGVQCGCCNSCYDESGSGFCWNGNGFISNFRDCF